MGTKVNAPCFRPKLINPHVFLFRSGRGKYNEIFGVIISMSSRPPPKTKIQTPSQASVPRRNDVQAKGTISSTGTKDLGYGYLLHMG